MIVEVGLKPTGGWTSSRNAGYYVSFDPSNPSPAYDMYMVANDGVSTPAYGHLAVPFDNDKVYAVEFVILVDPGSGDCTVRAWVGDSYLPAAEFVIPHADAPLAVDLVPGIGLYSLSSAGSVLFLDLVECDTDREGDAA